MARLLVIASSLLALGSPVDAHGAHVFVFDRTSVQPNDRITVRTAPTPAAFAPPKRLRPYQPPVRLYLVRGDEASVVGSRGDRRLSFVGSLVPDRKGRGTLTFSVPPLDDGTYELAVWCRRCEKGGRGEVFSVQRSARLQLRTTSSCPVTRPNGSRPPRQPRDVSWHGNGLLWAGLAADGTYTVPRERVASDGSIGNKLLWVTRPPWERPTISGERIDGAAAPLRVLGVNQGSFSGSVDPSYMSAVSFPTAGCWRLKARVGDVSLTYVVQVVVDEPPQPA